MTVTRITAQLRTTDLERSIRFYTEAVGLTLGMRYQDFYAGIVAGAYSFHLKLADAPDPSVAVVAAEEHFHLYLDTDDLDALMTRLRGAGVALEKGPVVQPWGMREIVFRDDSGHTIYAGQKA